MHVGAVFLVDPFHVGASSLIHSVHWRFLIWVPWGSDWGSESRPTKDARTCSHGMEAEVALTGLEAAITRIDEPLMPSWRDEVSACAEVAEVQTFTTCGHMWG